MYLALICLDIEVFEDSIYLVFYPLLSCLQQLQILLEFHDHLPLKDRPTINPVEAFINLGEAFINLGEAFINPVEAFINLGEAFINPVETFINPVETFINPVQSTS